MIGPAPEALAKHSGWCRLCRKRINGGEHYVARVDGVGWLHASCAVAYRRLREENAEADR
jgi:hypothetical protein